MSRRATSDVIALKGKGGG